MEKQSPMPDFYVPPWQTPLYWGDEQTGVLPSAVKAYLDHRLDQSKPFQGTQFALVRDYLRYYINAPCWVGDPDWKEDKIAELQASVTTIKTAEEMHDWLMKCLDMGIDPL